MSDERPEDDVPMPPPCPEPEPESPPAPEPAPEPEPTPESPPSEPAPEPELPDDTPEAPEPVQDLVAATRSIIHTRARVIETCGDGLVYRNGPEPFEYNIEVPEHGMSAGDLINVYDDGSVELINRPNPEPVPIEIPGEAAEPVV